MTDRIALVVNPAATRARPHMRARVLAALSDRGLVSVTETTRGGDGSRLAEQAVADGATLVVAMGGDGTVNEVACALGGTPTALAIVPAGSTNVFARALGWPNAARLAVPALADALATPRIRDVTLGDIDYETGRRVFCVNAGTGLDADTIHLVEARPWIKTRLRHVGVGGATVVAAARAARHATPLAVRVDGGPAVELVTLLVACGAPYAYLGSRELDLVPGAAFDGRLRWVGLRSSGFASTARVVADALRQGRHLGRDVVADGWATREIAVTSEQPVAVQADGEPLGWHRRVRMTPGPVLRVLLPPER